MTDRILCLAFDAASALRAHRVAERISLAISSRRVERRWREAVERHLASGGTVVTERRADGTVAEYLS